MRQPEITREALLDQASALFNTKGYRATSLSDITDATGLTKGAIYGHFANKEALELQAFDHMAQIMMLEIGRVVKAEPTAGRKLRAVFRFFETYVNHPIISGGCPIQNAAIEADDSYPHLRTRAAERLVALRGAIERILQNGIRYGQLDPNADVTGFATLVLTSMEGAVMMGRLTGTNTDMQVVTRCLDAQLTRLEITA